MTNINLSKLDKLIEKVCVKLGINEENTAIEYIVNIIEKGFEDSEFETAMKDSKIRDAMLYYLRHKAKGD